MQVRPILVTTICLTVSTFMLSSMSFASQGHRSGGKKTKTSVIAKLDPCCADPVLVPDVEGKIKRKTESRLGVVVKDEFEGEIEIPIPSPELGILTEEDAQNADLRLILSQGGVPYAECTVELDEVEMEHDDDDDDDDGEETTAEYKVEVKQKLKRGTVVVKEEQGSCGGSVPNVQAGDTVETVLVTNPDDRTADIKFAAGTFVAKKKK